MVEKSAPIGSQQSRFLPRLTIATGLRQFLLRSCVLAMIACFQSAAVAQEDQLDRDSLKLHDRIIFRSGAEMLGEIIDDNLKEDAIYVVFKKLDGSILKIDKARMVEKIYKLDPLDAEYNKLLDTLTDTAESHHRMAQWIKDQKRASRFEEQLQFHLERIMALDPNDTRVRASLGFFQLDDQRWVPKELYWDTIGFERKGTSWWPKLYREVESSEEQQNLLLAERKSAFASWLRKISNPKYGQAELVRELQSICDEHGVLVVFQAAKKEQDVAIRKAYIDAIGRVPTYPAMEALVFFAIEDETLGSRALDLLKQDHYDRAQIAARIAHPTQGYLTSKNNEFIQRAAFAIGELDTEGSSIAHMVIPLSDALVTTHVIAPADHPDRKRASFNNSGANSFNFGNSSTPQKMTVRNQRVLDALEKITGQESIGFAAERWKQWYVENYTHYDLPIRGARR